VQGEASPYSHQAYSFGVDAFTQQRVSTLRNEIASLQYENELYRSQRHSRINPDRDPEDSLARIMSKFWREDVGQDIAEYAVMLAVILVLVVGTVRLIGSNANTAFSSVASSLQ
jgi:Flp pilus assembly pilin Flp